MNENILSDITRNLTGGWYLDLRFLVNLIDEYSLDFDDIMESLEGNYWEDVKFKFNTIIYETLTMVANKFLDVHKEIFEKYEKEFEIFTNFMDSHIYFTDEFIQSKYEAWE